MTLRFHDGWDYMSTSELPGRWDTASGFIVTSPARNSGRALYFNGSASLATMTLDAQGTWIVGCAWQYSYNTVATNNGIIQIKDATTSQVELRKDASGHLYVTRGTTTVATGTTALSPDAWYYLEIKVVIADSGGTIDVHLDGVSEISFTGDTKQTANATADTIWLHGSTSLYTYHDDCYIEDGTDGTGSGQSAAFNDFLGDVRCETIVPDGNGNSSDFVGSDADSTDNYALVDEIPQSSSDYVESSTVTDKDTYTYGAMAVTSGTVHAVTVIPYAAKTDAGTRSIQTVARLSGTEANGSDLALSTTARYLNDALRTKDPNGSAWTVSNVNASEFGIEVSA